jgi:hypothetical protein
MKAKSKKVRETRAAYRAKTTRARSTRARAPTDLRMPFHFDTQVTEGGKVEVNVPLPRGTRVTVFVAEGLGSADYANLISASQTSLAFWNNPIDDAEWNDA